MRKGFIISAIIAILITASLTFFVSLWWVIVLGIVVFITIMGMYDMMQKKHSIMRTYPVLGRMRYWMEDLRPKLYQYFVESDIDGRPINRIDRSTIYQRAKKENDTMPFGTPLNVYEEGYEWMSHSIAPKDFKSLDHNPRVVIGNKDCKQPYSASIFNVSAMSFGSLSSNAIEALNGGAKIGGFAHNTGEGGISPYHLKQGGDLIWQIGTGYFGCRDDEGKFSPEVFRKNVDKSQIKMIELKLSQGAKPGHGGILPAKKNTVEIAAIRHVEPHTTIFSPPYHSAFSTPKELVKFIQQLRDLSGGNQQALNYVLVKKASLSGFAK
jgi:glutamate synthase domain-containing protein 2